MKEFLNYEDEIYKCSRCGLCQTVCPVYKATLNECALSRGKFNILNGIIKGELKFSDRVKNILIYARAVMPAKNFAPAGLMQEKFLLPQKMNTIKIKNKLCYKNF